MNETVQSQPAKPVPTVDVVDDLAPGDLDDLIDATDAAIGDGGGFGWVRLPAREVLERYWRGVITMPSRVLFVARLDGVICGTAQMITQQKNNEAQNFAASMTTVFVAPWARGHGLARMMVERIEQTARDFGYATINLDVRESQEIAIKLYEKMGYIHFGTHPFYARVDVQIIPGRYYYKILDSTALNRPHLDLI